MLNSTSPNARPITASATRHSLGFALAGICLLSLGCLSADKPTPSAEIKAPAEDELTERVADVLDYTLTHRELSIEQHAAWQILHGVLAYGAEFPVRFEDSLVPTVTYLQEGGTMNGWVVQPGRVLDDATDRRGLRSIMQPGTKSGQGHADQWLAVLSQAGMKLEDTIQVDDRVYTVADYLAQVQWDLPRNLDNEFSWTLIGLTRYLSTNSEWEASDGETWSIRRLVRIETEYALGDGPCGGTHRLIGLAMTLNKRREEGLPITGEFADAQAVVNAGLEAARTYQNADGSFSTNYVARGGTSVDLAQNLGTTGHLVEFVAIALPDDRLEEAWVRKAVANLCQLFEQTAEVPLECGALYHAAHGLVLYYDRVNADQPYQVPSIDSHAAPADTSGISISSQP